MTYPEIIKTIESSDMEDWQLSTKGLSGHTWFFKGDVDLRIETTYENEDIQCEDYKENWANCHPDPHATGYFFNIYFRNTLITKIILVSVDGGRATLPCPGFKTKKASKFDYKIAQIIGKDTLDDYMKRSGISIQ